MSFATRTLRTLVPDNVRAYLAADSDLAALFGDRIQVREYPEQGEATPAPYLVVSPGPLTDRPSTSESANAAFEISLTAYFPRYLAADATLTVPTAPTAAAGAAGALTVFARKYAVTFCTATGESYASTASAPLSLAAQVGTVTVQTGPAGTVCRRIWATPDGETCARFLDVIPGNVTTSYSDATPDDELGDEVAPYPGGYADIFELAKLVLWESRHLPQIVPAGGGADDLTDSIVAFRDTATVVDAARNQLVLRTTATYSLHYSMSDRQSQTEV